ncbi:hypothetical protein AAHC03_04385 [Spirometra sp. Aus1]
MIAGTKVVSLRYRPLREQDAFFPNGRPAIDPVTCEAILRRPFDIVLILLSLLGMSLCILHFIATISNLPPLPTPSKNASLPCGLYRGKWSGPYKVLRFYGVPYAIPPLAMPDLTTEELLDEVLAKSARNHRHLRWLSPQPAEGVEGCIISHHDKCTFQKSQWQCNMDRKPAFSFCAQPIPNKQDDFRDTDLLFSREKCLQLDVATPLYAGSLRPVVVVMAGYQSFAEPLMPPSYREPAYWPSDAAILDTDAVWVYVHYRLGVAGFFFDLETEDTTSAPNDTYDVPFHNFAIEDQMLALKWIKTNIRRFGGDPYRITLLGHGSGATNALALLDLQSRDPQGGEGLFNQAWLASGAVNWATSRDQNVPYEILSDLVSKRLGEKCEMKGHIAKTCSTRDLHRALMDDAIAFIYESTKELWNDSRLLGDILRLGAPRGWMYGFDPLDLKPPVFWTPEKRAHIFSPTKSSGGIRLVMTATSNELEGWPYTGEEWTKEDSIEQSKRIVGLMQRLQWTQTGSTDIQKSIDVLLGQVWAQELTRVAKGGASVWPPLRLRQEMHLQFLSFLRFACPQAWFLGTVGATRGEFYQIIHDEAPDAPFPHAPGPWPPAGGIAMPRRFAFHGIDMLILTGREMDSNEGRSARQKRFRAYSAELRAAFKKFVHGDVLDSKCRTGRGGWSAVLSPFSVKYC